ncbi:zinc finger CCCH domain-containing protein 7 [Aricia agestis]|uniref:zinc finger CCCH domain-containing protein 7 n=1 Tax=Aricia agestis TaxID=91739 RepID=UPI001C2065B4|nr:zinc finger CCCH domain-containing protein 7 [Aricia agestis]
MENQNQKVYINPNFKRSGAHLNQHFPLIVPNIVPQNARKIFVNPNFFPTNKSISSTFQTVQQKSSGQQTISKSYVPHCTQNSSCSSRITNVQSLTYQVVPNQSVCHQQGSNNYENIINDYNKPSVLKKYNAVSRTKSKYTFIRNKNLVPIKRADNFNVTQDIQKPNLVPDITVPLTTLPETKSRYCLIRNKQTCVNTNSVHLKKNTIKVSKYKTITISTFKKELKIPKPLTNKFSYPSQKTRVQIQKHAPLRSPLQSKYKYKNIEGSHKFKDETKEFKLNSSIKRKILNRPLVLGKYKLNNIPCPLFVKYGKCIRKLKARCNYLHDKKHVSLCRKFIKGLCHDKNCLLSHELSDKKMPTCYFYLRGMCTKENCSYVHVKLNNKTKICRDFLRGYCEKGENCLERHVLPSFINKKKKLKENQLKTPSKVTTKLKRSLRISSTPKEEKCTNQNDSDKRYYKDSVNDNEECETIKPVRCKLGTLPSYIQLQ